MSSKILTFGSTEWAKQVFSEPPARKLKGHSKHTQFHLAHIRGQRTGGQGRPEGIGMIVLEYFLKLGYISRFKAQPFVTPEELFGAKIVPDYLVQGAREDELYVIEIKTHRFLTRIKHRQLEINKANFQKLGMRYLAWTDDFPLNKHVRHQLVEMRRASNERYSRDEIERLKTAVSATPSITFKELYDMEFDRALILGLSWLGEISFDFSQELSPSTVFSRSPPLHLVERFLNAFRHINQWWDDLPVN